MSPRRFNCLLAAVLVFLVVASLRLSGLFGGGFKGDSEAKSSEKSAGKAGDERGSEAHPSTSRTSTSSSPALPENWRSLPIAIWVPPMEDGTADPDFLQDDTRVAKELIEHILLERNYEVRAADPNREDPTLTVVTLKVRCLRAKESKRNVLRIEVEGHKDPVDEAYADTQSIDEAFFSKHERLVRRIRQCIFMAHPLRGTLSVSSSSGPRPLRDGSEVRLDIGMSFGVRREDRFRVLSQDDARRCVGFLETSRVRRLDSDATVISGGEKINEGDGVEWIPRENGAEGNP